MYAFRIWITPNPSFPICHEISRAVPCDKPKPLITFFPSHNILNDNSTHPPVKEIVHALILFMRDKLISRFRILVVILRTALGAVRPISNLLDLIIFLFCQSEFHATDKDNWRDQKRQYDREHDRNNAESEDAKRYPASSPNHHKKQRHDQQQQRIHNHYPKHRRPNLCHNSKFRLVEFLPQPISSWNQICSSNKISQSNKTIKCNVHRRRQPRVPLQQVRASVHNPPQFHLQSPLSSNTASHK